MILFTHSTIWELLKILGVIKHVEEMLTFQYESKMVLAANNTVPKNVYLYWKKFNIFIYIRMDILKQLNVNNQNKPTR